MNKTLFSKTLFSLSLVVMMALASCSSNSPEAAAQKFLNAYYTFDVEKAIEYSSNDTKSYMEMIKGMLEQNPIPDSLATIFKETKVEIHSKDIKITGDSATVPYKLTMPAASQVPPMEKTLKMVKTDGKWLAQYTMMDAMAENQATMQEVEAEQQNLDESKEVMEAADSVMQDKSKQDADASAEGADLKETLDKKEEN